MREKQVCVQRRKFSPSGLEHHMCVCLLCVCVCVCVCVHVRAPLWASTSSFLLWFWPHGAVTEMTGHLIQCLGSALAGYKQGLINIVCMLAQSHPTLCDPMDCSPSGSSGPWDFPGKHSAVGCCLLLQGIFPTQGLNLFLLHWQADSLPLSHLGSPFANTCYL